MKLLLCVIFLLPVLFAQTEEPQDSAPTSVSAIQDKPPANAAGQSVDKSVIKPQPGSEAIKPKDYSDASGYLHPFVRMGSYVVADQKTMWSSPFHTSRKDAKW